MHSPTVYIMFHSEDIGR